jgi:uncharacterized protein
MAIEVSAIPFVSNKISVSAQQVLSVLKLSVDEECTIPFISRYRKEATGGLDEVQIQQVLEAYEEYCETEKRRAYILDTIKKMEKLTPELEKQILSAKTLAILEDIYAPYKTKKKSKGQIAQEAGLSPLAELFLQGKLTLDQIVKESEKFLSEEKGVKNIQDALDGAKNILIEMVAHNVNIKEVLRKDFWKEGKLASELKKGVEQSEETLRYKDYFEFSQSLNDLKLEKNIHRYLAIRRGATKKILKADVDYPEEIACQTALAQWKEANINGATRDILTQVAKKAYTTAIQPSLDLEIKTELKKIADEEAINVFGINLKNLLLAPYLGAKSVVGIDPGIRTGCKLVVIADSGKLLFDTVIYFDRGPKDREDTALMLEKLLDHFKVEHIAIGNGTYGRETLDFVEQTVKQVQAGKVHATLISEAGASVYSASEIARTEFPEKDVTVRGAISIARRFQDPLAELVKIDPKSIGVGQYQHDINQARLKKSLDQVVENCVNFVGVNLNTASAPLLSFVSGIGPTLAKNIVDYREKKGKIENRDELKKISGFGPKVFQQAAGFLRIYQASNPLDATSIHPEQYPILEKWTAGQKKKLQDLFTGPELLTALEKDSALKTEVGPFTFDDMIKSLKAPGQDPRTQFKTIEFRRDATSLETLKIGEWYPGVVTNITNFGAFVDIGLKENGLLHISQMADHFVSDAKNELKVGEEVKVKVIEIDFERRRIALSRKVDAAVTASTKPATSGSAKGARPSPGQNKGPGQATPGRNSPPAGSIRNSAFDVLKNLKLK